MTFLGYSLNSSSFRVYNLETFCVEDSSNVIFDKVKITKELEVDYNEVQDEMVVKTPTPPQDTCTDSSKRELESHKDHPKELVNGSPLQGVQTRSRLNVLKSHWAFLSQVEPKNLKQSKKEKSWMLAIQ